MSAPTYACDGIVRGKNDIVRGCRRLAVVSHLLHDGRYVRYCAQHEAGAGVMKLLRPRPWEIVSTVPTRTEA